MARKKKKRYAKQSMSDRRVIHVTRDDDEFDAIIGGESEGYQDPAEDDISSTSPLLMLIIAQLTSLVMVLVMLLHQRLTFSQSFLRVGILLLAVAVSLILALVLAVQALLSLFHALLTLFLASLLFVFVVSHDILKMLRLKLRAILKQARRSKRSRSFLLMLALTLPMLSGCLGYQVGNQGLFPADIGTVYVPIFKSKSYRENLGERLTEAIQKEIEQVTPYKLVGSPDNADCILAGELLTDTKRVVSQNKWDDPQQLDIVMGVKVSLIDRRSGRILACQTLDMPEDVATISGNSRLVPTMGESVATAQQQAIQRLASQIVTMMEKPW